MLKPADFNALPGASLSGLFSVTPMDIFPPSELGFKNTRNWASVNKWQFFYLVYEASPHPAEPASSWKGRKGKTWFSLPFLFCSQTAEALCWFVLALKCCVDQLAFDTAPWDVSAGFALPSLLMVVFARGASAAVSKQGLNWTRHHCPPHLDAVTNAKRETYWCRGIHLINQLVKVVAQRLCCPL